MDELEKSAYRFMNQPRNEREKLEQILQHDIIQAIEDGFNGHDVRREEILKDVNWLIETVIRLGTEVKMSDELLDQKQETINHLLEQLNE